jgi:predicted nucleic acid-binding protein
VIKEFFDTSVFVAAFWAGHSHHRISVTLLATANKKKSACGLHSLVEVYATMTALPIKEVIPEAQVLLLLQEMRERCTLVVLDEEDYFSTLERAANLGLRSGRIYDGLLLRCAAKCKAEKIYTWNLKHFRGIEPDLEGRILTP